MCDVCGEFLHLLCSCMSKKIFFFFTRRTNILNFILDEVNEWNPPMLLSEKNVFTRGFVRTYNLCTDGNRKFSVPLSNDENICLCLQINPVFNVSAFCIYGLYIIVLSSIHFANERYFGGIVSSKVNLERFNSSSFT